MATTYPGTIKSPDYFSTDEATSIESYLKIVSEWQTKHAISEEKFLSGVWFRGHGKANCELCPGVYRDGFTDRASGIYGKDLEEKRLNLEREMLMEFRALARTLLGTLDLIDLYFTAQHYGMPTRLLDWTTNPLAGLFFAVENEDGRRMGKYLSWQRMKSCRQS